MIARWRRALYEIQPYTVGVTALPSRLLGFDARSIDAERTPWPLDMRQKYSLRPEIECPLSVDTMVWPTYFLYQPEVWDLLGRPRPPLIGVDPDCSGGLWLSLDRMKRRLSEHARSALLLAVELFAPEETTVAEFPSSLIYSQADPSILPASSVPLGYDVADAGFISGLSNCGYTDEELEALRPECATRINDFGLLQTLGDAFAFVGVSNRRVPEHAPFWVYGLHRVT
jgi:hypothetical protein